MKLGEFIKQYREEHGMSQREFAARSGLTNGYISMLENDMNPKTGRSIKPTLNAYKLVSSATGMTVGGLMSIVEDDVSLEEPIRYGDLSGRPTLTIPGVFPTPMTTRVPRLGAIACGEPILAEQNIEDYDTVPAWVRCDFTLVCRGDSMINARIYDGDIVCIKQQPTAQSGQIAAVIVEGEFESEATLKRVRYTSGGVTLWPENPAYEPLIFTGEDANKVRILGIATHFISTVR